MFTPRPASVTSHLRTGIETSCMGDFLAVLGTIAFFAAMVGLAWALDRA